MKHYSLLAIQTELKLRKVLLLLGRDRNLKLCYIRIYPAYFLPCYEKAIDFQHI